MISGIVLASLLLYRNVHTSKTQPVIQPSADEQRLSLASLGFDELGTNRALVKNPFAWFFVLSAAAIAGLIYSGFFQLLKESVQESIPALVSWGPAGPVMATLAGIVLKRFVSRWKTEPGDINAVAEVLEKNAPTVLDLVRDPIEESRRWKVTDLAQRHEVGAIQRAVRNVADAAVDKGQLTPKERDVALSEILELGPGDDNRTRFNNSRLAIEYATRLIPIEQIDYDIERTKWDGSERRSGEERRVIITGWGGAEQRRGRDRRSGPDQRTAAYRKPGVAP